MLSAPVTHVFEETPLSGPYSVAVEIAGARVLYFSIARGSQFVHLTSSGRCLRRFDRESRPVAAEHIQYQREEQRSQEYDREFVDGATAADLDEEIVQIAAERIGMRGSLEKVLQYLGIAEFGAGQLRLRRAALLLFARDVTRWHPRVQVRILRIAGTSLGTGKDYNVRGDDVFRGNAVELLERAWDQLKPSLAETKFGAESLFHESVIYPEQACREALVNAVAHRDYAVEGRGIEVNIFHDRMEIVSPGGLLSTISVDDLTSLSRAHQSRNAYVSRVLREMGYMREMGEGIPRIFQAMKKWDLVQPEIRSERHTFAITLHHRSLYSALDEEWLKTYGTFQLTREEQKVLLLGRDGHLVSPQEIWDTLRLVDTEDLRKVVESLQCKGLLYSTLTQSQVTGKRTRTRGRRAVGRYMVRAAEEGEHFLAELVASVRDVGPFDRLDWEAGRPISARLSPDSPLRANTRRSLVYLGFIDPDGRPLPAARSLWLSVKLAPKHEPPAGKRPRGARDEGAGYVCVFCSRPTGDRIGLTSERPSNGDTEWERWLLPVCGGCVQRLPLRGTMMGGRLWHLGLSVGPETGVPPRTTLPSP